MEGTAPAAAMPSAQGELVPPWLKSLPLAPEFRPTAAEFADPIAYLLKIEPTAAPFGICKVVPPLPPPPKRTTLGNLSRSFAALHSGDPSFEAEAGASRKALLVNGKMTRMGSSAMCVATAPEEEELLEK